MFDVFVVFDVSLFIVFDVFDVFDANPRVLSRCLSCQVWSMGVMFWELLTGNPVPYSDIRGDLVQGMIVGGSADLRKSLPDLPLV